MARRACKTCTADNQDEIEALGLRCLSGELSWRAATKELGWSDIRPLQDHMTNHYVPARQAELEGIVELEADELEASINLAVEDLFLQMRMAPPEVKPLYAVMIQNLRGLRHTKPSQQHLIMAAKTIQELTGMKQEQRLLVQFAEHMFRELPNQKKQEALPSPVSVIDVEEL